MTPANTIWSNAALLSILNCLVYVNCALDLGNSLVNRRSIRVEENNFTISQVTSPIERQLGAIQKMMNYKKLSTHLYTPHNSTRRTS